MKINWYLWPPEEDPGGKCSKVVVVAEQLDQRNQSGRGASNHDGNADTSDDKENLGDKVNGDIDDGKNDNAYSSLLLWNPVIDKDISKGGSVEGRGQHLTSL